MVSRILGTVSTTKLTEINDLVFAGVVIVAEKSGVKSSQSQHKDNKPWWKRRLEGQINELRKHLSRIEQMDRGAMKDSDMRNRLMKKYQVKGKGMSVVKEEIKQRVKAKAAKVKRYDGRVRQFHQNRLFNTNQRQRYWLFEIDQVCKCFLQNFPPRLPTIYEATVQPFSCLRASHCDNHVTLSSTFSFRKESGYYLPCKLGF